MTAPETGEQLAARASSQAGLASYARTPKPVAVLRVWKCPREHCGGSLAHGYMRGGEPWEYCTTPGCNYELEG